MSSCFRVVSLSRSRSPRPAILPQHGHHRLWEKEAQAAAAARVVERDEAAAATGEGGDILKRKAMSHVRSQKLWTRGKADAMFILSIAVRLALCCFSQSLARRSF